MISPVFSIPYSSEFLRYKSPETVKVYYSKHLNYLSRALKPRLIHYISSENYRRRKGIHVSGILFTYLNYKAQSVIFVSDIDNFKHHKMTRNKKGVWYYILAPKPYKIKKNYKKIRYKFLADGIFVNDLNGNRESNVDGSSTSVYYFDQLNFKPNYGAFVLNEGSSYRKKTIFRVQIPDAHEVSLVGNFNHWNPKLDTMKKVSDGVFEIKKSFPKGKYIYLYKVSGEYYVDSVNLKHKFHPVYGRVSYIEVK